MQVAIPQSELLIKLGQLGWTVKKIDLKNGQYVAVAESEVTGQKVDRAGKTPEMAVASVYQFAAKHNEVRRYAALKKLGAWTDDWLSEKEQIAQAYSKMPAFDQKAADAWRALAAESKTQADAIRHQLTVEVVDDPEPYTSAKEMCEDVHNNKHFKVSRANISHPIWTEEDNINFRIVHDVIGHCQSGGDFSWRGENLACGVHFPLVSPLAREALFTECIAQTAYRSHFKGFGPQKVGLMSEFLHPVQQNNGEHVWVPHGGLPEFQQSPNANQGKAMLDQAAGMQGVFNSPGDWYSPGEYAEQQMQKNAPPSPAYEFKSPVMQGYKAVSKNVSPNRPHDPNHYWTPKNIAPPLQTPGDDYIGMGDTINNASKIDTQWQHEDEHTQKMAIMNAFRVALLSPRKHIKWNAAHYQALKDTAPETKALDLWSILEDSREKHNQSLGYPEGSHLAYRKQLVYLAHQLQVDNQWLSDADAMKEAKKVIFEKTKEFEEQLGEDPNNQDKSELRRYNMARKLVTEWMRDNYSPARGWQPGQQSLVASSLIDDAWGNDDEDPDEPEWKGYSEPIVPIDLDIEPDEPGPLQRIPGESDEDYLQRVQNAQMLFHQDKSEWKARNPDMFIPEEWEDDMRYSFAADADASGFASEDAKYGAFMGGHLDGIEEVGKHIDEIRRAALDDLDQGGKGHIFRNRVMNMNLKGVNPKVASFAWLLLAPMSSDLGIVDTHIIRGLNRHETDMSPREYYKMERMQRAAKDSTGYSHMPLGLYHWGLWDNIRNPGDHSDHSALRVLDPLPWDSPDAKWDAAYNARSGPWVGPPQFERGRGHMEQAARDFDQEMMGQPSGMVPLAPTPQYSPTI